MNAGLAAENFFCRRPQEVFAPTDAIAAGAPGSAAETVPADHAGKRLAVLFTIAFPPPIR